MSADNNSLPAYGQYGDDQPRMTDRVESWRTVIPMHPLSVGETLDSTVRLIRFNPGPYIGFPIVIMLVVTALEVLVTFAFGQSVISADDLLASGTSSTTISFLLNLVANLLIVVAGARVTVASVRGQKLTLAETFDLAKQNIARITARVIGLTVLFIVLAIATVALYTAGLFLLRLIAPFDLPAVGMIFFIIGVLLLTVAIVFTVFYRFSIATPALVVEDIGPLRAMSRSWKLTKGSFGYFLGLAATLIGIFIVLVFIIGFVVGMTVGITPFDAQEPSPINAFSSIVIAFVISAISTPISMALTNLVYINMRMRRENFHQEALFDAGADAGVQLDPQPGYDVDRHYGQPSSGGGSDGYGQPHDGAHWQGRPQWYGDPDQQ